MPISTLPPAPHGAALHLVEALGTDALRASRAGATERASALHEAAARVALGAALRTTPDERRTRGLFALLGVTHLVGAGRYADATRTAEAYVASRSLLRDCEDELHHLIVRARAADVAA